MMLISDRRWLRFCWKDNTHTVFYHQEALGFYVNLTKSDLTSSQTFSIPDYFFNALEWSFRPSTDRIEKLLSIIRAILGCTHV